MDLNSQHQDAPFAQSPLRRVLLVDDDPAIRDVLARYMSSAGLEVTQAKDGNVALEIFRGQPFDLVLSDVKMPLMDGLQLLEAVKDLSPTLPVVMISGYEDTETIVRALKMGAENFLAKPVTKANLIRVLKQALAARVPINLGLDSCCSVHHVSEMTTPSRPEFIRLLVNQMGISAEQAGFVEDRLDNSLRLALVEALTNAMEHGNDWDEDKPVAVRAEFTRHQMRVTISDQGRGFPWQRLPDPTHGSNLTAERGRGVFLMRTIMDQVSFNDKGNQVTLVKQRNDSSQLQP
jgi:CheY-like chemotaxis protein/anti-sigma regulatory factor (Ser/Thr protein kinase)